MIDNNLPVQLTPLIGREQEMSTLRQLLQRPSLRLVTITGPFGVGKTSLSLATGHALVESFADGVFLVSLAPISDTTLIIPTITQTLGVKESPRRLDIDNLKDYLQNRDMLLLLDNFEQIISAAPLLSELLSTCAGLKLLVTSREPLRLRGEQVFQLSTLALPDQSTADNGLLRYPGIALFVARAQEAKYDFELTDQNRTAVADLCNQLDGLPLAIELAAARIRLFPPQTILAQLRASHLQLLRGGARDLPDRHQTMRRAVRWSYDLLADAEQRALRWLSVFVGGCTMEAALAVIGPDTSIDVLDSLISKSLLRQTETSGVPRFTMLEVIREFGWEQLVNTAELEATRHAHAHWYTALAETAEPHLLGVHQKTWLSRLELEQDNFRAAFHWALETHDGDVAYRLAGSLGQFWFASDRWSEGRRSLEEALAQLGNTKSDPTSHAKVLFKAGSLARYQADYARARGLCEQSLALYRALDDKQGVVIALAELSRISNYQHDQTAKKGFLAEAATLIESLPDTVEKALAYKDILISVVLSADPITDETIHHLDEFERILRALNFRTDLALAIGQHAILAILQGNNALAASLLDEAMSLVNEFSDERLKIRIESVQAVLDIQMENYATARQRLEGNIQSAHKRNDNILSMALTLLAIVLLEQDMTEWSAKVLGMADKNMGIGRRNPDLAMIERFPIVQGFQAKLRSQLGEEAFKNNLMAGKQLTLDDLPAIPHPATQIQTAPDSLTSRELEVIHLLAEELSNPQIAERLVVSRRTVDAHLRSIYDKLGVKSRDAAVRVAKERRLLGS